MPRQPIPMNFELLASRFLYNPEVSPSGLIYKTDIASGARKIKAGTPVGCKAKKYWVVTVNRVQLKIHRIIWLLHTEQDFCYAIDHVNGNGFDNRIENLRSATDAENRQNLALPRNNRSGFIGVSWTEATGKWTASIMANGERHFLGHFDDAKSASEAYAKAKERLHIFNPKVRTQTEERGLRT